MGNRACVRGRGRTEKRRGALFAGRGKRPHKRVLMERKTVMEIHARAMCVCVCVYGYVRSSAAAAPRANPLGYAQPHAMHTGGA